MCKFEGFVQIFLSTYVRMSSRLGNRVEGVSALYKYIRMYVCEVKCKRRFGVRSGDREGRLNQETRLVSIQLTYLFQGFN